MHIAVMLGEWVGGFLIGYGLRGIIDSRARKQPRDSRGRFTK